MNSKNLDIELMRIVACFFVIFNHTENRGFFLFSLYAMNSLQFWLYMIVSVFCTFSVPLFFMIFGVLMLEREPETLKKLWGYRITRIMLILMIWSFFYYLVEVFWSHTQTFNIKEFMKQFFITDWNYSYWYLYAYMPMLMTTPLLQRIVKGLKDKDFLYMFLLFAVFNSFLPIVQYLLWKGSYNLNGNFRLGWLCSSIFVYPCFGYFLQSRFRKCRWNKKRLILLWIVNISTILISCYMTYLKARVTGECNENASQAFFVNFVIINWATTFITCKYVMERIKISEWMRKLIVSVGGCTFEIYLMHILFLKKLNWIEKLWEIFKNEWHMNYMVTAFLVCGIVYLLGYIMSLILKKIPILNNLI